MNILILTGKFGMGHWSASQSLRQRLLRAFPKMRSTDHKSALERLRRRMERR